MANEVFISWSGDESRALAENLRQLLKFVLANPPLFVASKDVKAGEAWFSIISEKLDSCDAGIIVVTPQNKQRPWLHFEAGAIAKRVGSSAAIPLLCGVPIGDLGGTALAQLQALEMKRDDIRQLCTRLNDLLALGLVEADIDEAFETWWSKYEPILVDPALWGGVEIRDDAPTTADLSVQLNQVSAAIVQLSEQFRRSNHGIAFGIQGQGQLATMNVADIVAVLGQQNPNVWYGRAAEHASPSAFSFGSDPQSGATAAAAAAVNAAVANLNRGKAQSEAATASVTPAAHHAAASQASVFDSLPVAHAAATPKGSTK